MMKKVQIKDAQSQLRDLLDFVSKDNEVILMDKQEAVAKILPLSDREKRKMNESSGGEKWTVDDFDINLAE